MNCWRINLRHDQRRIDVGSLRVTSEEVTVLAPQWVQKGLEMLKTPMNCFIYDAIPSATPDNTQGFDPTKTTPPHFSSFTINKPNLRDLQKITRNQHRNTSGIISWSTWYSQDIPKDLIVGMKDLARQCVIVGQDLTTGYGGYGASFVKDESRAYLCDLAGLQFQQKVNSGRLVLVEKEPFKGYFDEFIFSYVVGEERKTFDEVQALTLNQPEDDQGKRYIKSHAFGKSCYFDTFAYKKFIQTDVVTTGRALSRLAKPNKDRLNLKFLKYGTGFFAGPFTEVTNNNILEGVLDGLETLFENYEEEVSGVICALEFPFYSVRDKKSDQRLAILKKKWGIESRFSRDDALKSTVPGLVTATTNCADSHAVFGNEMGYGSVDAAIATNLKSKGDIFCPLLNCSMKEEFLP